MATVPLETEIMVLSDHNATVASVKLLGPFPAIEATGASKREQFDVYDEDIAIDLAVGRALVKLGYQMVSRGHKRVKLATAKK